MDPAVSREHAAALAEPYFRELTREHFANGDVTHSCSVVGATGWAWLVGVEFRRQASDKLAETSGGAPAEHPVLYGLGPALVDKQTGAVHPTGTGTSLRRLERELGHRSWWNFWGPTSLFDPRLYDRP